MTLGEWIQMKMRRLGGLKDRAGTGMPRFSSNEQMGELSVIVETGPDPEVDGVFRWLRIDLKRW